jgi:hypothetical protein
MLQLHELQQLADAYACDRDRRAAAPRAAEVREQLGLLARRQCQLRRLPLRHGLLPRQPCRNMQ